MRTEPEMATTPEQVVLRPYQQNEADQAEDQREPRRR
jgi:hypothetical protein